MLVVGLNRNHQKSMRSFLQGTWKKVLYRISLLHITTAKTVILVGQLELISDTANGTVPLRLRTVVLSNSSSFMILPLLTAVHSSLEIRQPGMSDYTRFIAFHAAFTNLEKYLCRAHISLSSSSPQLSPMHSVTVFLPCIRYNDLTTLLSPFDFTTWTCSLFNSKISVCLGNLYDPFNVDTTLNFWAISEDRYFTDYSLSNPFFLCGSIRKSVFGTM